MIPHKLRGIQRWCHIRSKDKVAAFSSAPFFNTSVPARSVLFSGCLPVSTVLAKEIIRECIERINICLVKTSTWTQGWTDESLVVSGKRSSQGLYNKHNSRIYRLIWLSGYVSWIWSSYWLNLKSNRTQPSILIYIQSTFMDTDSFPLLQSVCFVLAGIIDIFEEKN